MAGQPSRRGERDTKIFDFSRRNWCSKWYHLQRMEGDYSEIDVKGNARENS